METFEHLDKKTNRVMGLSDEDRIRYLYKSNFVKYSKMQNLLHTMNHYMNLPKRPRMPDLLIVGDSNNGKTTIVKLFTDMHPAKMYEDENGISRVRRPVVYCLAPYSADEKSFYISILEQFWTSFNPNSTTAKLRSQALGLMREQDVRILIIDEIHNLLETTMIRQRTLMNMIKNLTTELEIPIIGVGTGNAHKILSSDAQHASRFDIARLPPWKLDEEFLGLLVSFETILPLRKQSHLAERKKSSALYQICEGNLGNLHRLLMQCSEYAIRSGEEEITMGTIERFKWLKPTHKESPVEIPI